MSPHHAHATQATPLSHGYDEVNHHASGASSLMGVASSAPGYASYDTYRQYSQHYGHYDKHTGSLTPQLPTPSPGTPGSYQPLTPLTPTHTGGAQDHASSCLAASGSLAGTSSSSSSLTSTSIIQSSRTTPKSVTSGDSLNSNSKMAVVKQEAGEGGNSDCAGGATPGGDASLQERTSCAARDLNTPGATTTTSNRQTPHGEDLKNSLEGGVGGVPGGLASGGGGGGEEEGALQTSNNPHNSLQHNAHLGGEDPSADCNDEDISPYSRQFSPFYMSSLHPPQHHSHHHHNPSYRGHNPHHTSPFPPPLMPAPGMGAPYRSSMGMPMPPSFLGRNYPDLSDGEFSL